MTNNVSQQARPSSTPEEVLPTITVITPCLNAAATIERALESVRSQGYPHVEHIVIDGGSSDGTVDLVRAHPEVVLVSEPDDGLSDALNKGIKLATGVLVGWLNADDWYLPGAFDAVAQAVRADPSAQWVTGRCPIVDEKGDRIRSAVYRYKNLLLDHYSYPLLLTQNFVCCPATFVRADAYRQAGEFDVTCRYSMDYDMFLRVAHLGRPIVLTRDLAVFLMADGTLSMSGFESQFREHHEISRRYGAGHPVAVAVNGTMSAMILGIYRTLRALRRATAATKAFINQNQFVRRRSPS